MTIAMDNGVFRTVPADGEGAKQAQAAMGPGGAPVLCVCGYSGAGKTTLVEAALHELDRRGLAVAVVKHDAHGFCVDRAGKDSDRFFQAGASVALGNAHEQFQRRGSRRLRGLGDIIADFSRDHDLVLVEGHKATPLPKLWLASEGETCVPQDIVGVEAFLPRDGGRLATFLAFLDAWLPRAWTNRDVRWMRFDAAALARAEVVIGGGGAANATSDSRIVRLPIAPDLAGAMGALVTAHRWAPESAWMVLPLVAGDDACAWLAAQRRPGMWTIRPQRPDGGAAGLVLYEPQALARMASDPARFDAAGGNDESPRTLRPRLPESFGRIEA